MIQFIFFKITNIHSLNVCPQGLGRDKSRGTKHKSGTVIEVQEVDDRLIMVRWGQAGEE